MTIAVLKKLCSTIPWCDPAVLEQTVELALEIAREGREGRRIGTLFTLGKAEAVLAAMHYGAFVANHSDGMYGDPGFANAICSVGEMLEERELYAHTLRAAGYRVIAMGKHRTPPH